MPSYRTPLPALSAGLLESALNGVLALDETSPVRLARLDGRSILLVLEGTGLEYLFDFDADRVTVTPNDQGDDNPDPDTVVSATPAALFSMAAEEMGEGWAAPGSRVTINGDASLARDFERLFSRLDPDLEGIFTSLFGDVIGHQFSVGLREGVRRVRETADSAGEALGEVLREGARGNRTGPLIGRDEFGRFADSIDDLRDAVARVEARLAVLVQEAERSDTPEDPS